MTPPTMVTFHLVYITDSFNEMFPIKFCTYVQQLLCTMFSAIPGGGGREGGRGEREGEGRREGGREGRREGDEGERREGGMEREGRGRGEERRSLVAFGVASLLKCLVLYPFHSFLPMVHWDGMDSGMQA